MIVDFGTNDWTKPIYGLDQYDYGQKLELHGLSLPEAVEVHFAIDKSTADAERRVGITKDGVTTVAIPDKMLEQSRPIVAYVYVSDSVSGKTVRKINMPINPRQKPQDFMSPGDPLKEDPFRDAVMAVNDAAERAKASEKSAEAWTHGSEDYPEREEDNARYYAEQAKEAYGQISDDAKKQIDEYIKRKEDELKGDPGNDGITPHIGENGNWYIGDTDTGINAHGIPGNDGITPHIGENGNWYIGDVDTGMASKGSDGKSAYQYAQEGGYTGTEEDFKKKLAEENYTLPIASQSELGGVKASDYDPLIQTKSVGISGSGYLYAESDFHSTAMSNVHKFVSDPAVVVTSRGDSEIDIAYPALILFGTQTYGRFVITVIDSAGVFYTGSVNTGDDAEIVINKVNDAASVKRILKTTSDTSAELQPNNLYLFPEMTELSITLNEIADTSVANEYHFMFTSGETATALTLPDTVIVPSGFTIDANKIYEISILENLICAQSWEV